MRDGGYPLWGYPLYAAVPGRRGMLPCIIHPRSLALPHALTTAAAGRLTRTRSPPHHPTQHPTPNTPTHRRSWVTEKVLEIPRRADFSDYSAMAFAPAPSTKMAILSQADAKVWVSQSWGGAGWGEKGTGGEQGWGGYKG